MSEAAAGSGEPSHRGRRFVEALLPAIVETIPDMIFVKDADELRYVFLNRAGEEFLGVSRDKVLGKSDHEVFAPDQAEIFFARDREVLASGAAVETPEEEIRNPIDGIRFLRTKRSLIVDEQDRPRYILGISQDITERKAAARESEQLERQLLEAQKMEAIGLLAESVAHDFADLLTVILSAGQGLLDSAGADHPQRREIDDIVASAHRGADLTRQLLAFGRRQLSQPQVIDLNGVVANVEMLLRRLLGEEVELVTILARELGLVRADPGQLEQVLISLAVNARDAMPDGGTLTLTTSNVVLDESFARAHPGAGVGLHVLLSLSHTGLATNAEAKARSFESFTTKRPGTGTWLGLSTVERIARQSGGCMLIESQPGSGTTFRIYLPRARAAATLHGNETILVVDDDALLKDLVVRVLRGYGYTVLSASDAGVAATLAASHPGPIHLLVIDAVLRGASGTALPAQLTDARPELRVLYVSGHSHDALVGQRDLAPADALLHKPFTPVSLARAVRDALDA